MTTILFLASRWQSEVRMSVVSYLPYYPCLSTFGIPIPTIVTGFWKTFRMGFFVKIEFDVSLISSTIELTHLQV